MGTRLQRPEARPSARTSKADMLDILAVTSPIFLLIALGFVAVKHDVVPRTGIRALGAFVINFALPALLFRTLAERSFAEIMNVGFLLAYALASLAVMAAGIAFGRFLRGRDLPASTLIGVGMAFSNSGFIGYPILLQLLGPAAGVALALAMTVENLVLLPLILALAESEGAGGRKLHRVVGETLARLLKSPLILTILAGAACGALGLTPPAPLARAVDLLANASGAVALFVIGGTLVGLRLKGMVADVVAIACGKLLLHPLAMLAALLVLPPFDPRLQLAALTLAAVPMLSIYPILGHRYGHGPLCAAALLATTAASFATITGILWLAERSRLFATAGAW
jgi:predicted permease